MVNNLSQMGSRVVQKLRDSGIEVSRENEILVIEHFESLPKRYALGVKDAMAEVSAVLEYVYVYIYFGPLVCLL